MTTSAIVLKKLEDMGQLDNTIIVFTTDNGAETITFPDGGTTPFKGGKLTTWEGGMRAPVVIRWPGLIKPGTVKNEMFAALDWLPTLVDIAGGPKGDALKKRIEAGSIPASSRPRSMASTSRLPRRQVGEVGARIVLLLLRHEPSAVRYKNWKMYFAMVSDAPAGLIWSVTPYHWTQVVNIKRDPFETRLAHEKTLWVGRCNWLPVTAYLYDWNMLPIGQLLWLKELSRTRSSRRCRTRRATTWNRHPGSRSRKQANDQSSSG